MKIDLISFQDRAVSELRLDMADALVNFARRNKTQVVSLQAPTGAGKTIIAAALIEGIFNGITLSSGKAFEEQPEAIFVWLSDSPELNEQSKQKIELKTDKLKFGQCITIADDDFDQEVLDDGKIYFLNTQKISKNGNLTKHSDGRQYTIWETLDNTIENKSDRLYFIIDEAHRGAKSRNAAGTDTTIMQRFIKGYEYYDENRVQRFMRPMPVVLGISATAQRFNTLISNITDVMLQTYVITADEVRSSGLLKDRIVITYPDNQDQNSDMVLLEAAVAEWKKKCIRWHQYTYEQHYSNVDPVMVVQVCKGSNGRVSDTNLENILEKIEEKNGAPFKEGEVVHSFGDSSSIEINGLTIPYCRASEIADNHKIKIVFFKEALSTGWDCPRAETMMSFAVRQDPTYITQLLGRMVRTPLQCRVQRDEFLNDVKLYLPHFSKETVKSVIDELQSNEGGDIPTEINGQSLAEPMYVTYTAHTRSGRTQPQIPGQVNFAEGNNSELIIDDTNNYGIVRRNENNNTAPEYTPAPAITMPITPAVRQQGLNTDCNNGEQLSFSRDINRAEIVDFINKKGFATFFVRSSRINCYLKSLLDLATLLTHNMIYQEALNEVTDEVLQMIRSYIDNLHRDGTYDTLASQVLQFQLSVQVFDPFGRAIDVNNDNLTLFSDTDLDRQLNNANATMGRFGFTNMYGAKYYDEDNTSSQKIDCILFAADENCLNRLEEYAKNKFHRYAQDYRLEIVNKSDACKKKYHDILADSDKVSKQLFAIPEVIVCREDPDGKEYNNHLLASENTGVARIRLNGWESDLIEEESKREDFVCWLRNPERTSWALCIPREEGGDKKAFYPDFIVVRKSISLGYVIDILEPHGEQYADNLSKAKALAEYAIEEDRIGRIQLIRKTSNISGNSFIRLDLTDLNVRNKVLHANTDDELRNIFNTDGITR